MLGNKKVHAYHISSQKNQAQFYLRYIQTFLKEHAIFPARIRTIVSRKFSRMTNTNFQSYTG